VTVSIQTSTDLQVWQPVSQLPQSAGVDATTGDPMMEFKVDVTGQSKSFIRLQVVNGSSGLPTVN
jgi:hypothetical protein